MGSQSGKMVKCSCTEMNNSVMNTFFAMALIDFYGDTCPHCIAMKPTIDAVEKKLGVTIERVEVWNNQKNADRLAAIDKGLCGGVPFFYNEEAKTFICGATDEATLLRWASGKKGEGIGEVPSSRR